MKDHPFFKSNPLFRENSERNPNSDSSHRTFANYTDHLSSYPTMGLPKLDFVSSKVERISHIRLHSVESPNREDYPDLENVQILAFQRIIAFHDFLDSKLNGGVFWNENRRPSWCKGVMVFQVAEQDDGLLAI